MSLMKFLELFDLVKESKDRNDPHFNQSLDVNDKQYPNYDVIPNYNYKPELIPGYHLLTGGSYGFVGSVLIGVPLINRKYRLQGYRDWKLMEKMCVPFIKCCVLGALIGIGCGALLEVRRIANEDFHKEYNKKVF